MANLPYKDSYPSIISSLSLFNAENIDVSVRHGYCEQIYPKEPLSETIHFQIYSNEDYFVDMSSTFIDLHVVVKKSDNEMPILTDGIPYENFELHNFFDKSVST